MRITLFKVLGLTLALTGFIALSSYAADETKTAASTATPSGPRFEKEIQAFIDKDKIKDFQLTDAKPLKVKIKNFYPDSPQEW